MPDKQNAQCEQTAKEITRKKEHQQQTTKRKERDSENLHIGMTTKNSQFEQTAKEITINKRTWTTNNNKDRKGKRKLAHWHDKKMNQKTRVGN